MLKMQEGHCFSILCKRYTILFLFLNKITSEEIAAEAKIKKRDLISLG